MKILQTLENKSEIVKLEINLKTNTGYMAAWIKLSTEMTVNAVPSMLLPNKRCSRLLVGCLPDHDPLFQILPLPRVPMAIYIPLSAPCGLIS